MINYTSNPWENIHLSATRRIDHQTMFDFFWVRDDVGKFGFLVKLDQLVTNNEFIDKIRGISLIKRIKEGSITDVFLILNSTEDWQLFLLLCSDLLEISKLCSNQAELIASLNNRLKRWQKFLSYDNEASMSEIKQRGLFSELLCLIHYIIPNFGTMQGLVSWVGPDSDKQDFSLPSLLIEVKSFTSSKGPIIKISSLHQLLNDIKPLFLITFGLSREEKGMSVVELIALINKLIDADNNEIKDLFELKLAEYGYVYGVTQSPFYKFRSDSVKGFIVSDNFPKLVPSDVQNQILAVEYSIDLSKCSEFQIEPNFIFKQTK